MTRIIFLVSVFLLSLAYSHQVAADPVVTLRKVQRRHGELHGSRDNHQGGRKSKKSNMFHSFPQLYRHKGSASKGGRSRRAYGLADMTEAKKIVHRVDDAVFQRTKSDSESSRNSIVVNEETM
eukprot:scaffold1262_cov106-Cylindrotheca_fusiformis.AAC.12